MATNPMQRKSRISFILGMLVMLVISGIIIAFLFMQLTNYQKKEQENKKLSVQVYVLNQDVSSGQVITTDMYTMQTVTKDLVPANAISDMSIITNYALQDKEGNEVYTKSGKLSIQHNNREYELKQDDETGNYYIEVNDNKEYIDLNNVPLIAKVTMKANTVITKDLLAKGEDQLADDMRREEYNSFILPMDLTTGDYIDVRLMLPSGQNFIVVSKKEVEVPNINGEDSVDTIWLNVSEGEILTISSAIVDAYRIEGAKLYVDKYTEAGMQKAATPTYVVTSETYTLLQNDPNLLQKAKNELLNRYSSDSSVDLRNNHINKTIQDQEEPDEKLVTNMQESIKDSQDARKNYLDSLSGTVQ